MAREEEEKKKEALAEEMEEFKRYRMMQVSRVFISGEQLNDVGIDLLNCTVHKHVV